MKINLFNRYQQLVRYCFEANFFGKICDSSRVKWFFVPLRKKNFFFFFGGGGGVAPQWGRHLTQIFFFFLIKRQLIQKESALKILKDN